MMMTAARGMLLLVLDGADAPSVVDEAVRVRRKRRRFKRAARATGKAMRWTAKQAGRAAVFAAPVAFSAAVGAVGHLAAAGAAEKIKKKWGRKT